MDELIDMIGLTARAAEKTENLSGGQNRRLDVAVGVIGDPVPRREAWELVRFGQPWDDHRPYDARPGQGGGAGSLCRDHRHGAHHRGRHHRAELTDSGSREAHVAFTVRERLRGTPPELPGFGVVRPPLEDTYFALVHEQDSTAGGE
ncbi:hypothetical protein [Leekyejoonella antrihumi]|uniref:ATP-binding cassette domain-containing protein n=1 Tax=Leekyejoonella antrihumi TaxID=1660198 RepID=A0A563E9R7_9MICO|nr:hypothetical protein [Leekyejoonella antrihumi]TWP38951.1 hypothetical protein FGL98_00710 [Leekyejoonella antrihumi]